MLSLGCSYICFASSSQVIGQEEWTSCFTSQVTGWEDQCLAPVNRDCLPNDL